ncbi:MAG TPA: 30S ribosomal protein S5 [Candidatus Megaira endosymbiont of Hartmannula sinica]|nr:30S ribosomal protein S5 [Candidatus Megaera endosymbiont of Hartmannula sinica]
MKKKFTGKKDNSNIEKLVRVNRVTKVVKGGSRFSLSALVVTGNKNGKVGFATGKAKEVSDARSKASKKANKSMISVPMYDSRTIYYDVIGKSGSTKVLLKRAKPGTGVKSCEAMRLIFECLGIKDISTKAIGSTNENNIVRATFDALSKMESPLSIEKRRGVSFS